MVPLSSGSRKASSACLGNSGNSSKNKTPWCASDTSPGRGGDPPPTKATALAEWCKDLEAAVLETIPAGKMTKDLAICVAGTNPCALAPRAR